VVQIALYIDKKALKQTVAIGSTKLQTQESKNKYENEKG
jgi:hypothetical protein